MQSVATAPLSHVQQIADDHQQITAMQGQAQAIQGAGIGIGAALVLFAVIVGVKNLMSGTTPTKKPKACAASA
jgi:hypothetical protein